MKVIQSLLLIVFINSISFSQNTNTNIEELINEGKEKLMTNLDSSLLLFHEALELSKEIEDKKQEAYLLGEIGKVHYFMNNIDSAEFYYKKTIDLSLKINYYLQAGNSSNNLGLLYLYIQEYDKSAVIFRQQIVYYSKANDTIGIIDGYNNLGTFFLETEILDSSSYYYKKSLDIAEGIKDSISIATINANLGIVFHTKGDFSRALECDLTAARILEQINDLHNLAITFGNIGSIYLDIEEYDLAKKYLLKSDNLKDSVFIENYYQKTTFLNLGIIYMHEEDYDNAEKYYNQSLEISINDQDIKGQIDVHIDLCHLFLKTEQNDKALKSAITALELSESINSEQSIASSCKILGKTYNVLGQYNQAIKFLNIAYKKSIKNVFLTYILDILDEQKIAYTMLNDYKNAFLVNEKIILFQDSLKGIEMQKQLVALTTIYETEKKEQEIKNQKLEIEKQKAENKSKDLRIRQGNIISISVGIILLLALTLTFILFRSIKQKKKANKLLTLQKEEILVKNEQLYQKQEEITQQRDEIQEQHQILNIKNEQIQDSINYAQRIQLAAMPQQETIDKILNEYFILFKPRDIVSGDFFWIKQIKRINVEYKIVVAADCTGHGVPGAFVSMLGISLLNELFRRSDITDIGHLLDELRNQIKISLKQTSEISKSKDGMDLSAVIFDEYSKKVQFAGANNSLIIVKSDTKELVVLKADRQPIGVHIKENPFTKHEIQLKKGDQFYMLSDGYVDQFGGESNSKFMIKNFKKLLVSNADKSMNEQKSILETTLSDWQGKNEQIDDILVIGVKI